MNPKTVAALIELAIPLLGGLYATLLGFQVVGRSPSDDPKYRAWRQRWGRHLKWLGPLVMIFGVLQFVLRR